VRDIGLGRNTAERCIVNNTTKESWESVQEGEKSAYQTRRKNGKKRGPRDSRWLGDIYWSSQRHIFNLILLFQKGADEPSFSKIQEKIMIRELKGHFVSQTPTEEQKNEGSAGR